MLHSRQQFVSTLRRATGLYFLSPTLPPNKQTLFLVKIGLAWTSLTQRLEQYLICYPEGFYLYSLAFCEPDVVHELERQVHQYLRTKGRGHEYNAEWFYLTIQDLHILLRLLQRWPDAALSPRGVILFQPPYHFHQVPPKIHVPPRRARRLETALATLPRRPRRVSPRQATLVLVDLTSNSDADSDSDTKEEETPVQQHWQTLFSDDV